MTDRTLPRPRVHAAGSAAAASATAYDFASPELLTDVQRGRLEDGFAAWAQAVSTQMTAKTRAVVTVIPEPFVLTTLAAFGARFGRGQGYIVVAVDGSRAHAVYALPTASSIAWASRFLGGPGRPPAAPRGPTDIERALIWATADEHLRELELALAGVLPALAVEAFTQTLGSAVGEPDELMLCARFAFEAASGDVPVDLALPAAPLLRALGHGLVVQDPVAVQRSIEHHVSAAPVQVALRFDETRVDPAFVLGLGQGSLIPLEHPSHRPLALTVNGETVLRAAPGGSGDRLACVVVDAEGAPT